MGFPVRSTQVRTVMGAPAPFASRTGAVPGPHGGLRVTPSTDTGWATYNAGSRLFLPAATNLVTNPRPAHTSNLKPVGWSETGTHAEVVFTYSDGATHEGIVSKHVRITAGTGIASRFTGLLPKTYVNSECAPADSITTSVVLGEVTLTGCTLRFRHEFYDDANVSRGSVATAISSPGAAFATHAATVTAPALATKYFFIVETSGNFDDGDVQEYSICQVSSKVSSVLEPYFDGSYPNCAWTGTPDASTSTRTASDLVLTDYVQITSAGAVAAGAKVVYAKNPASTYFGPAVVTDVAKSAGWQSDFAAETNLNVIWARNKRGDMLIPLASNGLGWIKR